MPADLKPSDVTTLGELRPGDMGELVLADGSACSDPFVVQEVGKNSSRIRFADSSLMGLRFNHLMYGAPRLVRYLGKGRIEYDEIVMDDEPDVRDVRISELEAQVKSLREAAVQAAIPLEAIHGSVSWELCKPLQESVSVAVKALRSILAETAPKGDAK